jgi:multidrug resistance efflux pump
VGQVLAVRVREGDRVRAGQVLVEIDARDVEAQAAKARAGVRESQEAVEEVDRALAAADQGVAAARANGDLAGATLERYRMLAARNSVSRQEFDEVEARHKAAAAEVLRAVELRAGLAAKRRQVLARGDQARADVAGAAAGVSYTTVRAPFGGVVTAKQAEVGSLAAPGVPLVTVEDDGRYRLEAAVDESRLPEVRVGSAVTVRVDALADRVLTGRVEEVVPAVDPGSRSALVKIGLGAAPGLRSGLFGRALFAVGEREALSVPRGAVVTRGQLTGVFAVDRSNTARLRLVQPGREFGDRVEVLSGVAPGDRVVVEGVERVADGSRLE